MNSFITLYNGQKVLFSDCIAKVPSQVYTATLHIEVCDRLASRMPMMEDARRVYANFLISHCKEAREITAGLSLINSGQLKASRIRCILNSQELSGLIPCTVSVDEMYVSRKSLFNFKSTLRFIVKIIFHKFYRIFPRKKWTTDVAVRAWVELSEEKYRDQHKTGTILIYPFYLNMRRHVKYIRRCYKEYDRVQIIGLPYSFYILLRHLFATKSLDIAIILTEVAAYKRHALEIKRYAQKELYTSDEFESAAMCLAQTLKATGTRVINTAHGLSFTCPYVEYSVFYVNNQEQKRYFSYKSPKTDFVVAPLRNAKKSDSTSKALIFKPYFVFVHSNFLDSKMEYENTLQYKALNKVKEFCDKTNHPMFVKLHPNTRPPEHQHIQNNIGLNVIKSLAELPKGNAIFVALFTAAFYDFYKDGPFLFIAENIFPLKGVYGFPVLEADLPSCEKKLMKLCDEHNWEKHLNSQMHNVHLGLANP